MAAGTSGGSAGPVGGLSTIGWPCLEHSRSKKSVKGEDFMCSHPEVTWAWPGGQRESNFALFAVFDGHGGKAAATETMHEIVPALLAALDSEAAERGPDGLAAASWDQDLLPAGLTRAFNALNKKLCNKFDHSGTTATVAVLSREHSAVSPYWASVCLANVGDSHAFVEFAHIQQRVSADHRLDNNPAERERILSEGGEVERAGRDPNDKSDPLRVWPGGLMMSRTLGDKEAGTLATSAPEINLFMARLWEEDNTTPIPLRLIIASDGLWDVMSAKQAFAHARRKNPQAAAALLTSMAAKKAGKERDDISVIIVDLSPTIDGFAHTARSRQMSNCSTTSVRSAISITSRKASMGDSGGVHYHCWDPAVSDSPRAHIDEFEKALEAAHAEHAAALKAAEEERLALELALAESAKEEASQAAAFEERNGAESDDGWEAVPMRPRRNNANNNDDGSSAAATDEAPIGNEEGGETSAKDEDNHEGAGDTPDAPDTRKPCAAMRRHGSCKRGDDCPYAHDLDTNARPKEACRQFLKSGKCKRGNRCPYLHDAPSKPAEPCRAFAKGNCSRGDKCRYSHEMTDDSATAGALAEVTEHDSATSREESASKSKPIKKSKPCFGFLRDGSCKRGDKCMYDHPASGEAVQSSQPPSANQELCRAFQRNGKCPRGSKCKYAHDSLAAGQEAGNTGAGATSETCQAEQGMASEDSSAAQEQGHAKQPGVCRAFKQRGSCKYGDSCRFTHPADNDGAAREPPSGTSTGATKQKTKPRATNFHIVVRGFGPDVKKTQLREYFSKFGEIAGMMARVDGRATQKRFAFIRFADPAAADTVLSEASHHLGAEDNSPASVERFVAKDEE